MDNFSLSLFRSFFLLKFWNCIAHKIDIISYYNMSINEIVWNGNEVFVTMAINVIFAIFFLCTRPSYVYDFIFVAFFSIWHSQIGMGDYWHRQRSEEKWEARNCVRRNMVRQMNSPAPATGCCSSWKNLYYLWFTFGFKCSEYKLNVIGLLSIIDFLSMRPFLWCAWNCRKTTIFATTWFLPFSDNFTVNCDWKRPNADFHIIRNFAVPKANSLCLISSQRRSCWT